ncbi:alpha/beta fold hydrolase [Oceaniglobus roseus]|uniref:alpha/beta fold hydrolase n=1 Tax=Oceaniglobus roseus TaxID=1737570 RepID=UPI000C7E902E|nr:alpha/beta fold hydrolase [Kandeliimicrobium roseum]
MLNTVHHGEPGALPPLLIVPGLFGSARNWGAVAARLASDRQVVAVDMRNHGGSFRSDTHGYPEMAGDLAEVLETLDVPADVLGHSMGGKAAMVLALTRPGLVRRLIVADIAPVAYRHTQLPLVEAMRGLDLTGITRRSEADARLAETVEDRGVRAFLLQSLDVAEGRWRLNLDVLAREMPKIMGWPGIAGSFDGPTLFLTGAESGYVRPEHRGAIRALFPAARFAAIRDAGHWLHAEKPREVEASVRVFLGG